MDIVRNFSRIAFGCAFPRAGRALVLAAVCAFAYRANSEVCYYLPDGTGTWADPTRWKDGKVPAEGDAAEISDGTACVTEGDSAVVSRVAAITLQSRTAVIEFNVENDFHVPNRIIGKGKIVKKGKGRLFLDAPYENFYYTTEGIEVNDGELYLVERPASEIPGGQIEQKHFVYGPLTVNAPGKLFLRPTGYSYTCGISGDGIITNTSTTAWQLYFETNATDKAGAAYSFSGILSPNVHPTFIGVERQDFLSDLPYGYTVRNAQGTVGVYKFGNQDEPGSLGTARLGLQANATDKPFRFIYLGMGEKTTKQFRVFGANPGFIIDGGAHGGLELSGELYLTYGINKSQALILDGSNATPCRLSGDIKETRDNSEYVNVAKASSAIIKRGSGTWRLAPALKYQGVVAVESGVLEAEALAEKGTYCSLGDSTILLEPVSGKSREELKEVPYAVLLGDGTFDGNQTGTLSYVGEKALDLDTRAIALSGSGRLRNATGLPFAWTGITSSGEGNHALHLDGEGSENRVISVTNGLGKITVVKEGTGTWTLDGDIDVSRLESRNGVLDVHLRRDWKYYRFNIKKVWGSEQGYHDMLFNYLAFFDANKNCRSSGLVYNKKANGKIENLSYGEVAYCSDTYKEGDNGTRTLSNAFIDDTSSNWNCCQVDSENKTINIDPDNESTWVRIYMRLIPGAPVASYDLRSATRSTGTTGNGNKNTWGVDNRMPKAWSLEGSMDGVEWELLSENEDVVDKVVEYGVSHHYTASANLWMSTKDKQKSTGYEVEQVEITEGIKMSSVESVAVSGGGTLLVDATLGTSGLCVDFASASGVIDGVSFNEEGVIEIKNYESGKTRMEIGIDFNNCSGVANFANWAIKENGRITSKKKLVAASNGRLYVVSGGMTVIVR